jgi:hypothetical protein
MATTAVYLSGKAKWAKVYTPDEKYQNWTINLYMDKDNLQKYQESGMTMNVKKDEEGPYVTFRRPQVKLIKQEMVKFGPPIVVDSEGNPFDKTIGNGSEVTVKVLVYNTMKGPGHRLEKIRIDKWVEYVKQDASLPAAQTKNIAVTTAVGFPPF